MRPWVQIPSTTSILFRLYVLSFEYECEKNENKKRVRDLHILIKKTHLYPNPTSGLFHDTKANFYFEV